MKIRTRTYVFNYIALIVLLALTVAIAYVDLGIWNRAITLLIAFTKSALVILIFMHGIYGGKHLWGPLAVAVIWLFVLIGSVIFDVATRELFWLQQYQ